jgi:hypothetical protein
MSNQNFELNTWAEAEVTPGPGREQQEPEQDDQGSGDSVESSLDTASSTQEGASPPLQS